ncbi:MAG: discoidin domain-containing protein [Gemmataceae bacterium]
MVPSDGIHTIARFDGFLPTELVSIMKPKFQPELVTLEDRCNPAVTHTFSMGALTVDSDTAADKIQLMRAGSASDYFYVANGVKSATFTGVSSITVNGNDGADIIDASGTATPIVFNRRTMTTSASNAFNDRYAPINAFSGAGLIAADGQTHTATGGDGYGGFVMWLSQNQASNMSGVNGQYLQIGLGDSYNLSKLQLWNYNQNYSPAATVRGVKVADIQFSNDGTTFTTALSGVSFTQAPGTDAYNTPDMVTFPAGLPSTKFVRILVQSNFASDSFGNFVGISEVKLFGQATASTITGGSPGFNNISASTTFSGMSPYNAGNGSGLNSFNPPFHNTDYRTAWMSSNQANVAGQAITFDFGSNKTLAGMRVWNYNQNFNATSYAGRGMKGADIQFSTDGVTYSTVLSPTLSKAPAAFNYLGEYLTLPNTPTRYVRIVANSNGNNNVADAFGNYVGLSEVRFDSLLAAPANPLPVTINGGNGTDTITAGNAADVLSGGANIDTFIFHAGFGTGTVLTDFTNGTDKLDLRPLGVNAYTSGGSSLIAQGGSASPSGPNVIISVPPSFGPKTITLNSFAIVNLDDADFVP